ncbi:hypothetical protein ACFO3K_07190 [Cellulomonas algicola]|uniref:DUF308 domain-containing protein n=1 Tax=Cellulomonas algicola TaxID=2071633 RepID=A0A401V0Q6_9CELL|nr:hypothetical protein [Cellulomonas algicola]GCD20489.1 hypothetical protein CTKZ_20510 [Cellulomonas algicola]
MAARPDDPDDAVPPPGSDAPGPADDAHAETDDERWDAIVAQLGDLAGYTGEDDDDEDPSGRAAAPTDPTPDATAWTSEARVVRSARDASGRDWSGTDQIDDAEQAVDAEEHFVPPDPGPVLGGDPLLTMAWIAAAGMPLFLLAVVLFWRDAPSAIVQAAAAVFVIGVAVLVWRMPHRRDPEDDDTGAVV